MPKILWIVTVIINKNNPYIQTLIDFEMIPQRIEDAILSEYQNVEPVKGKVFDYLRTHRLNQLLDQVGDFSL